MRCWLVLMRFRHVLLMFFLTSACTENVYVEVPSKRTFYRDYGEKIVGHWAAIVDTDAFPLRVEAVTQSGTYFVDANSAFMDSTKENLAMLFDSVEFMERKYIKKGNLKRNVLGFISVKTQTFKAQITLCEASVELSAIVIIDVKERRLFGFTANGDGIAGCREGDFSGSEALSEAATIAIREVMNEIGSIISGSSRLRQAAQIDT